MMEELSAHILDLVTNSLRAHAQNILVAVERNPAKSRLTITVRDDGTGMDEETQGKVQDPFYSTKAGRKVGLGVPLLKGTAETTGGSFRLSSEPGKGTEIQASFDTTHPDLPPLGNLKDTIFVLTIGNPDVNFTFRYVDADREFLLDTKEVRDLLEGIPLNHPEVINFLSKYLDEHL
jgi:signal transduction histidine kinase